MNVLQMKCLRSLDGVPRMDLVRNDRGVGEMEWKASWRVARIRSTEMVWACRKNG